MSCASPVPLNVNITAAVHAAPQDDVIACHNLVRRVWSLQLYQDWFPQPCNTKQMRHPVPEKLQRVLDSVDQRRYNTEPINKLIPPSVDRY